MLSYIDYLVKQLQVSVPTFVVMAIVILFLVMQIVGEILEFKGKVVPEFVKVRKYFARKRKDRQTAEEMTTALKDVQELLADVKSHYSQDNIQKRDEWMKAVDAGLADSRKNWKNLNDSVLALLIDSKRNTIIQFASRVIDPACIVTREEFNRVFKLYKEYESIIKKNKMTNGEVDISIRIIREAYEERLKRRAFVENIRGYDGQ